jgi:hypothetical protein
MTIDEIFDGRPMWLKPSFDKIKLGVGVGSCYGDVSNNIKPHKEYHLLTNELKVLVGTQYGTKRSTIAIDSIFDFINTQDVFQEAFQVNGFRNSGDYVYVNFKAYVANYKKG